MKSYRRLNAQHAAGARARRVYVCSNASCEVHYDDKPPVQCHCGGIEFIPFPSRGEATHWAQLRMLEKRGIISNLRRQVWYPLYAPGPNGNVKVASYVADFVFIRDGVEQVCDSKPAAGIDDLAALKLKIMEAQGIPVTILTKGIYS